MSSAVVRGATAVVLTLLAMPAVITLLRRKGILDVPGPRSSHREPTPRAGGLGPAAAALAALAVLATVPAERLGLLVAAGALAAVGLLEDLAGVPALARLALQVCAAGCALPWLLTGLHGPWGWEFVFTAGVVLWLVAYANAFNFMDGIDGLSVAQVIVAGQAWYAVGRIEHVPTLAIGGAVIAGAAYGFGPFNFPRASVFLGDVGSYFFGAWLAALVVIGLRHGLAPEAMLGAVAVYLADTGSTLLRRVVRGEAWYLPHRQHTYQQLVQLGWSHARTTLVVGGLMVTTAGLGAVSIAHSTVARIFADFFLVAVLAGYLASPWLLQRARTAISPTASRAC